MVGGFVRGRARVRQGGGSRTRREGSGARTAPGGGRNKFRELARPIDEDPVRRARVEEKKKAYDALITLHELRQAVGATQSEVAQGLGVSQPYIAKIEKRGDMSLTTLSSYLAALGGRLEVRVVFSEHPEDNVALAVPTTVSPAENAD